MCFFPDFSYLDLLKIICTVLLEIKEQTAALLAAERIHTYIHYSMRQKKCDTLKKLPFFDSLPMAGR